MNPAAAWDAVLDSPLLGILLTLAAMVLARWLAAKAGHAPLVNPILIAIGLVGGTLLLIGIDYATYLEGAQLFSLLLGPATVALAIPLYREARRIAASAAMILPAVIAGSLAAMVVALLAVRWLGGDEQLALSMAPKSATTPVSIAAAEAIGGIGSLAAVFTLCAGILGALLGPELLNLLRIRDPRLRGLGLGVGSHAIVTARLLREEPQAAAFAALALAITALVTGGVLPFLAPLLLVVG